MKEREKKIVEEIQHVMNVLILGDANFDIVHQWKMPLIDKGQGENLQIGVFNI